MPAARHASLDAQHWSHDSMPEPLGEAHQFFLADAIAIAAPDWSVELYCDSPGAATIIIMPEDADDTIGPTFFVHREGRTLCLDQLHWDNFSSVGRFADLGAVARALRAELLGEPSIAMPESPTLH